MRRINYFFILSAVLLSLTSCRSAKDITMFQDMMDNETLYDLPKDAPEYRIKPFDNLYVSIRTLDEEINQLYNPSQEGGGYGTGTEQMYGGRVSQYINGYMVSAGGMVNIPILGKIQMADLNLMEAQEKIITVAKEHLKDPNVKVKILNFKVNVNGEVRNPGVYYNYEGKLNVVDAIGLANGITDYADIKDVIVIRHKEDFTKTFNLNFRSKDVYLSDAFYLQPNDIVYIPPNKYKRTRENNNIYSLILSTISTLLVATTLIINNSQP